MTPASDPVRERGIAPADDPDPQASSCGMIQLKRFCQPPAYDAGTNPMLSLMSSIGRFSSALNVEILGECGATARQRRMFAHFAMVPSRLPRCSLTTSVPH